MTSLFDTLNMNFFFKIVGSLLLVFPLLASTQSLTPKPPLAQNEKTIHLNCHEVIYKKHHKKEKDPDAFTEQLHQFANEMANQYHLEPKDVSCIKNNIHYNAKVVHLVKPFPKGTPKNWKVYRTRFIEPKRIHAGAKFWDTYQEALTRAEKTYGVPSEIIVGIIGVETIYGKNKGSFSILNALATLAFDYPEHPKREARLALFRNELEQALLYASENNMDPLTLQGSFAGAIGWPQFLPSSIRKYAVDFDHDGRIDLHHSPIDAIGSVANYLKEHGWKKEMPIVFSASLKEDCPFSEATLDNKLVANLKKDALEKACIKTNDLISEDLLVGLIDLQNGYEAPEYRLGTDNFFAITQYNRSYFYAMAVIDLGQAIKYFRQNR